MRINLTKKRGLIALAVWMIIFGLSMLLPAVKDFQYLYLLLGIGALVVGALILIDW
jgi:uncharacterized membrane protein HdeD (DUF308 family)